MGFSGNILQFDKNNNVEDFTFILSTKNYKHIGKLNNIKRDTVRYAGNLNSKNEISFEVYKFYGGEIEEHWDKIIDFKSVYIKELNEYFEIKITYNDTIDEIKTITGTSLCEAELGQTNIYGTEINTETDINRTDYVETTFYNSANPKASLLHRVLSFAPNYKINYVDSTLCNLQRSFSIDGTSVYDFLTGECAEQFNCLFAFNSTNRTINVYDLYSTCPSCEHRGAFSDSCPECGNTNIIFFGEDTEIFVNKENLTDSVTFETDTDSMKNCFKLTSGDADMDTAIMRQNPNGSAYIYTITPEQREDMSEEFLQRFDAYNTLYDSYIDEYQQLSEQIYNVQDDIDRYMIYMMPEPVDDDKENNTEISIANQEIKKLTVDKLSPVGVATLSSSTSVDTVNSAIKNYTRVFVNTSLVKVEILDGSKFTYKEKNSDGWNYGQWSGAFKLTNYSDKEDTAITSRMTIQIHDNYPDFCQQTAMKEIALNNEEGSVFDVLNLEDINEFKSALELYSLNRLISFKDAISTAMTTLMGLGEGSEKSEWYDDLYVPYLNKLEACELEIDKRTNIINALETQLEELKNRQSAIQKVLNFKDFLGEELYLEFCSYKREQEYNNSNYISDGLSNAELMEKARDFFEVATKELYKSSHSQHSISCNLYNLLAMPEFKPLVNKFSLGNFIRVQVGQDIYRLRLIGFEFSFSDLSTISVTFSDVTKMKNELTDVRDILDSADSMSRSYDTVSNQANKGQAASTCIEELIKNSLDAAVISIKNNVNEDVTIGNTGILCRAKDDITGGYSPKQVRIVSNKILFTKNNWRSAELGIGEMTYTLDGQMYEDYGVITQYLISGKIIAGDIYSANYSSTRGTGAHIDLENGSFILADSKIMYDANTNNLTLKGVTIAWDTTNPPEITDISGLKDYLNQLDGRIQTYSQDTDPSINWSATEKSEHIGDLWFDTKNNLTKRWNGSSWDTVTDSELEELAKSKAQIFTTTPTTPYYVGDLWVQGSSGDIMNCIKTRTSGSYSASDWTKSSKYTDDTVAKEALEAARQGISDAAAGISLANAAQKTANNAQTSANNAQNSANEAKESANNAQTRAENAETNAKKYADQKDTSLSTTLTNAYKDYTNSEIGKFDTQVANYFGLNGGTIIGENYMISPLIAGGYLNITNTSNQSRVIIDPNNLTGNNYIFQIHNGSEVSIGIKADGTANINGHINAKSLTLGSGVSIAASKVSGLSSVATSGKYSDLSESPNLDLYATNENLTNNYVNNTKLTEKLNLYATTGELENYLKTNDLNAKLGDLKVAYRGDVQTTQTTDSSTGITTTVSKYIGADGTEHTNTTYTTDASNYVLLNRTNQWGSGNTLVKIEKDGLFTAKNALVYGTVYATDGEFTGKVTASSGSITGNLEIGGSLYSTKNNHTVTFRGVQSNLTDSVFFIKDSDNNVPFRVNGDGSFTATKATVKGTLTAGSGSIIGGVNGWEITSNQIRSRDMVVSAAGVNAPRMILSTGSTVADTYMLVSDCFQLGGWQDENHTAQLGARFIGNVEIHGACKIKGATIAENMAITGGSFDIGNGVFAVDTSGNLTTKNINATGGKIGNWSIQDGMLIGTGNGTRMALYPNGQEFNINGVTGVKDTFFLVIHGNGGKIVGLTIDGVIKTING